MQRPCYRRSDIQLTYPAGTGNGSSVSQEADTFNLSQKGFFAVEDLSGSAGVFGTEFTRYGINAQSELETDISHQANSVGAFILSGNTNAWVIDNKDAVPNDP